MILSINKEVRGVKLGFYLLVDVAFWLVRAF